MSVSPDCRGVLLIQFLDIIEFPRMSVMPHILSRHRLEFRRINFLGGQKKSPQRVPMTVCVTSFGVCNFQGHRYYLLTL
jgi:hypothetical protein